MEKQKQNISTKGLKTISQKKTFELELNCNAEDFVYDIDNQCKIVRVAEILGHYVMIHAAERENRNSEKILSVCIVIKNATCLELDKPKLLINKKQATLIFDPKFVFTGKSYISKEESVENHQRSALVTDN